MKRIGIIALVLLLFLLCKDIQDSPKHYYLMLNNQLVEYSSRCTRIYYHGEVNEIDPGFIFPDALLEKNQYLYTTAFSRSDNQSKIIRIKPDQGTIDTLYRPGRNNRLGRDVYAEIGP